MKIIQLIVILSGLFSVCNVLAASLEEVIVTAQKREQSLQDISQSVTAISDELLTTNRLFRLNDLSNHIPNVTVGQSFGFSQITIRGVGFESAFPIPDASTAVHVDGAVENSPSGQFGLGLYDVERIEVVRGPAGTLYGRNATGGAINIITRKPTEETTGYGRLSFGNLLNYRFEGALGGAIINNKLQGRLAVKLDDIDGDGININNNNEINETDSKQLRGHLKYIISDQADVRFTAEYSEIDGTAGQQLFRGASFPNDPAFPPLGILLGGTPAPDIRDINSDANILSESESLSLTMDVNWDITNNFTFRSISNYKDGESEAQLDIDFTDAAVSNLGTPGENESFSQELQLLYESGKWQGIIGLFYFDEERSSQTRITPNPDPLLVPDNALTVFFTGSIETESAAVFGNITYDLTETIELNAGGRYSYEERSGVTPTFRTPVVLVNNFSDRASFNDFSPMASVKWRPFKDGDKMVYFRFAEGFKSGVMIPAQITPVLKPERITSYEIGFKGDFANDTLRFNASAFYYEYEDQQLARTEIVPGGGFQSILENAAESEIEGVEVEFEWLPVSNFKVDGFVSYLDATLKDFITKDPLTANQLIGNPPIQAAGNTLPQSPEWSARVRAEYQFPIFENIHSALGFEIQYKDKIYFSAVNNERLSQDAVTTLNADLKLVTDNEKWSVLLWGKNLTDKDIYIQSFPFSTSRTIGAILAPPRSYGISLGYNFN